MLSFNNRMVIVFYMKSKEFSVKPINNIQASLIVDEIGANLETTSLLLGVEVKAVETYGKFVEFNFSKI